MKTSTRRVKRYLRVSYFKHKFNLVYFLVKGHVCYVLPRFDNANYLDIVPGQTFGHTDLGFDRMFTEKEKLETRVTLFDREQCRLFTVQAFGNCDLLTLSMRDLLKMKLEFPRMFDLLFENIRKKLEEEIILKDQTVLDLEHAIDENAKKMKKVQNKIRKVSSIRPRNEILMRPKTLIESQMGQVDVPTPVTTKKRRMTLRVPDNL